MPAPLDYKTIETLRHIRRGLEQIIDINLPAERETALDREDIRVRRENTDFILSEVHQKVRSLLPDGDPSPHDGAGAVQIPNFPTVRKGNGLS